MPVEPLKCNFSFYEDIWPYVHELSRVKFEGYMDEETKRNPIRAAYNELPAEAYAIYKAREEIIERLIKGRRYDISKTTTGLGERETGFQLVIRKIKEDSDKSFSELATKICNATCANSTGFVKDLSEDLLKKIGCNLNLTPMEFVEKSVKIHTTDPKSITLFDLIVPCGLSDAMKIQPYISWKTPTYQAIINRFRELCNSEVLIYHVENDDRRIARFDPKCVLGREHEDVVSASVRHATFLFIDLNELISEAKQRCFLQELCTHYVMQSQHHNELYRFYFKDLVPEYYESLNKHHKELEKILCDLIPQYVVAKLTHIQRSGGTSQES